MAELEATIVHDEKNNEATLRVTGLRPRENPIVWFYAVSYKMLRERGLTDLQIAGIPAMAKEMYAQKTQDGGQA